MTSRERLAATLNHQSPDHLCVDFGAGFQTGMGVGAVFGPWLGGYIYDVAGTYLPAFILCIVCIAL